MCIQERRGTKEESMMEKMGTMWVRLRREWWVSFKCWVVLGEVWMEGDKKWKESECLYWTRERTKTERTILSSTNNRKYLRRKSIYEKKKKKKDSQAVRPNQRQRGVPWKSRVLLSPCAFVLSSSRKTSKSINPSLSLISLHYKTIPTLFTTVYKSYLSFHLLFRYWWT